MMRTRLVLSAAALVAASTLSACGASGAPTDASEDEFCTTQNSLFEDLAFDGTAPDEMPSEEDLAKDMNKWAEDLEEVGTPEGIPEDARKGFEVQVEHAKDIKAEDLTDDNIEQLEDDYSDEETEQMEAFFEYVSETCGDPLSPGTEAPSTDDDQDDQDDQP